MSDLAEIIPKLMEAVIVLDAEKRIVDWLGASERIFGWSVSDIKGRNIEELLSPRDSNGNPSCIGAFGALAKMRAVKAMPEQEVLTSTSSGEVWVGITSTFDRDTSGRIERTIVVARDISRRKRIDLAKSEVISAVSHELRSPLTSVKGFTSTLLHKWDKFDDDTKKHLLFTINTDADRVTRLIGELLDVSRLEAGRLQLRRQIISPIDIARRVVDRIKDRSENHDLIVDMPEDLKEVFADPDKVEQVMTNLVENAVKYTESGTVRVGGSREESLIKLTVSDEGEGIPVDQRVQVFGKFFRRGERAGNPTGTGLGLYISKGLVEAHGGRIWVEDNPRGGAVFAFTLPIQQ